MGLIFAKLCFLCMDTDSRGRVLRAIQHNNAGERKITVKTPARNKYIYIYLCVCVSVCVCVCLYIYLYIFVGMLERP